MPVCYHLRLYVCGVVHSGDDQVLAVRFVLRMLSMAVEKCCRRAPADSVSIAEDTGQTSATTTPGQQHPLPRRHIQEADRHYSVRHYQQLVRTTGRQGYGSDFNNTISYQDSIYRKYKDIPHDTKITVVGNECTRYNRER